MTHFRLSSTIAARKEEEALAPSRVKATLEADFFLGLSFSPI
jgi:hypothetical protein